MTTSTQALSRLRGCAVCVFRFLEVAVEGLAYTF